jgi:hypothetical protein
MHQVGPLLSANSIVALNDSPDMLKITFEGASTELLSKLMQGGDEKYRCSVAFQVRPVMMFVALFADGKTVPCGTKISPPVGAQRIASFFNGFAT